MEPELTRVIAEVLDRNPQTNEAMAERAKAESLQQELSLAHKKLEQTRGRLEVVRGNMQRLQTGLHRLQARAQELKARGERLAEHNDLLSARYSARRYRLADAFVGVALRMPVVGKLMRRISAI